MIQPYQPRRQTMSEGKSKKSGYAIRKLTEKECWRLMGFTNRDFTKAASQNSATQLYRQAGNSIVKQVLMAIFLQMGIQGKKKWNEMSVEERQNLVNGSLDFI
jgi:site-specific DNA-cytosine methylase